MNKRWLAITTFCLGMAAAPLGFQVGEALFKSADAQEEVVVEPGGLADDLESYVIQKRANCDRTDRSSPATATGVIVDQIQPNAQSGPVPKVDTIAIGDGLFFESIENTVKGFDLTIPSAILSNAGGGVVSFVPATGPVPIALDLAVPLMEEIGQSIMVGGATTLNQAGQRYYIGLTGGTLKLTNEPTQLDGSTQPDLSKQFMELSNQLASLKLKKLHPQSLALEVEILKKNILDLEAASKLDEVQEQLKRIMHDYPESPAAQSAHRMLEGTTNNGPNFPGFPATRLTPTPDVPVSTLPTY